MPDTTSTAVSEEVPEDAEPHCFVDHDVPRTTEESASSISPIDRREAEQEMGSDEDAADLLAHVWESSPVDSKAYVELVIRCIQLGVGSTSVGEIDEELTLSDALPPLTKIPVVSSVLSIDHEVIQVDVDEWVPQCTTISLGPAAEKLDEYIYPGTRPKEAADAVEWLVETGDLSRIAELVDSPTGPTHSPPNPPGGQGNPEGGPAQGPAPANEPNILGFGYLFATPPYPRLSAYRGRFEPDVEQILGCTRRGNWCTRRGNSGSGDGDLGRDRRSLEELDVSTEHELLHRSPLPRVPDRPIPTSLYNDLVEWRPILEWSDPLMAIYQLILTTSKRDDNADLEGDCTGMPIANELVFAAFGYHPQSAWNRGLNSGMLLELCRKYVDSDFHFSGWDHRRSRARVVLAHSIPDSILETTHEFMLSPEEQPDRTFMLSGTKANSRRALGPERRKRRRLVDENEPTVAAPESTLLMKEYLNDLDRVNTFSHGRHGVFADGKLEAMKDVAMKIPDEQRRIQELRKVFGLRSFPKPLYAACDRSPRLRADRWNQLMNVKTELRKELYVKGKDWELDLSKAHLGSYVPTLRQEGIPTPELDRHLQANLEDDTGLLEQGDLWMDLASTLDPSVFTDLQALRDAVKRLYSVVYGMERGRVLHQIAAEYADATGFYPDSHAAMEPLLSHPLVAELFETRKRLRGVIDDRGGLKDADGRFIPLSKWDDVKDKGNRWRGVMAYVNASYEQKLMAAAFDEARAEKARDARTRFKIWLYQADGFTVRMFSKASHSRQITRLQNAVAEKADALGVPTELEVDYPND